MTDPFQLQSTTIVAGSVLAEAAKKITLGVAPTNKRGSFTVLANGKTTKRFIMFNPNTVDDDKGINWGTVEVPGSSHPVYHYGSGGERIISFELWIDGDRGRFGREQTRDTSSLSIKDELAWYRSLVYPVGYGGDALDVSAPIVLFTFGELYNNVRCIVKKAPWKVEHWVPGLTGPTPVRARIPIQLAEVPTQSQVREQVLNVGGLFDY